jgi:tRNA 5-methylaminomethyl-2-thiouridine biosynthesis bifunctional protein
VGFLPADTRTLSHPLVNLPDLEDGFHRILLDSLRISLTVCVGGTWSLLGELQCQADHIRIGALSGDWDQWRCKALARCCKRGTRLRLPVIQGSTASGPSPELLAESGFVLDEADSTATYAPHWPLKRNRDSGRTEAIAVGQCAVIGAGLSGASVANALAQRGWRVTVIDEHAAPAQAASGLPAGLAVDHVSADDNARSRLSRQGTRLMLRTAEQLLRRGDDWDPTGVTELRGPDMDERLWHSHAGWIRPAAMVGAWLKQPNIRFRGDTRVTRLHPAGRGWALHGATGEQLLTADLVVVANAHGCVDLLQSLPLTTPIHDGLRDKLADLQQLHGTVTIGSYSEADAADSECLRATPMNGSGSWLPGVPGPQGLQWLAGATYETSKASVVEVQGQHCANLQKLQRLLPDAARIVQSAIDANAVQAWSGTRCVTYDRMPLVGPVVTGQAPSLWMCTGMGSRGLSFAALCAQLLVARIGAEPLPVAKSAASQLDSRRKRRQRPLG